MDDSIIIKLAEVKQKFPSLRLGQILVNALNIPPNELDRKLYYISDEDLTATLQRYINELTL
jgi:hypothetical protein